MNRNTYTIMYKVYSYLLIFDLLWSSIEHSIHSFNHRDCYILSAIHPFIKEKTEIENKAIFSSSSLSLSLFLEK